LFWLRQAPYFLRENYVSSMFVVFPCLFLALFASAQIWKDRGWSWVEQLIALGTFLFWSFINLSPPNEAAPGTLLRGEFAPRFYMPFFVVILLTTARHWKFVSQSDRRAKFLMTGLLLSAIGGNLFIVLGPLWNSSLSANVYARFYKHAPRGGIVMVENLERFGRRPLGFCQEGPLEGLSAAAIDGMFVGQAGGPKTGAR
jgi:hypothetical protein